MEEDGEDIQGGDDFLSDDNDFEDDEFTDEEDYKFLESAEDGIIPIDVDEDNEEYKTEEPLDADDWLQTIENNLEVAGVEAAEKVLFATHYLSGPARAWWTSARAMNAGQMMTWEDFKLKFSKYHVPQGLIKKMRDEFRELKQGRMSVVEYRDRFLTLSRPPARTYRPNYGNNNGGTPKPGGNNNNNNNHNSHNNNGNNTNTNTGPRTGSNAIPVTPKDKSTINCYECGVVGHYSKECPKKLAKIAANTAAPAQQQRRFAGRRNQNNNNGRFYHMTATEAQEAPQTPTSIGQVARLAIRDVCGALRAVAGDQGHQHLRASRLSVLPVVARRWVLATHYGTPGGTLYNNCVNICS
ncbi:hypothetical protein QYE76_001584 [Lolium multiflorum]|uniref:CCHC-type domain-containing protein n=1 Tax=Lolium multiflorum TaxID=4521 RepID=A0AAD8RLG1_LOLMU|nr:hypothetical protein QYE76_001584 [Lolium multiflorum]